MISKQISTVVLAAALFVTPATESAADADGLVGGIVGGIIGGTIVNEANRNRRHVTTTRSYTPRRSSVSSATRAANRETQTALNYFGFNAGQVDGVVGRGTRAAIVAYQANLGYSPTGQLTPYERDFLVTSYHRAIAGGPMTAQLIASNPMGARGVLIAWRDEALGLTPQAGAGTMASAGGAGAATTMGGDGTMSTMGGAGSMAAVALQPAPTAVAPQASAPVVTAAAPPEAEPAQVLPNFLVTADDGPSLASHCNKVSLLTSTNGGFVTLEGMTDPVQALNEQFCLARTYAIAEGEAMAEKVQGFTQAQIAEQCESFGPALAGHVSMLSITPMPEVLRGVSGFVLGSGMAAEQLAGTATICLSVGYRTDNLDVAIGSALLLAALGERAYGELIGHHLVQGFGVGERPDLALAWYDMGFDASAQGLRQVVAPGQPERTELLREAAYAVAGRAEVAPVPAAASEAAATLPLFEVQK